SPYFMSAFGILGVVSAGLLSFKVIKTFGAITAVSILWVIFWLGSNFLNYTFAESGHFFTFLMTEHIGTCLITFSIGFLSSWLFFRYLHFLTFEIFLISGICIYLLSPHRDYHLDSPQFINGLAWRFGLEPQAMLLTCGGTLVVALMIFLNFSQGRLANVQIHEEAGTRKLNRILATASSILILVLITGIGKIIYARYDVQKGLITNGVGEGNDAGTSPLGFHSALGSTNHPAALVRLEGDYSQNPFTPMLYFREGALSKFNGHELVIAGGQFDADVNNTGPSQPYTGIEDPDLKYRSTVIHSVYLLADQKAAFAIDYPLAIKQLKNPEPDRFKFAYRAYSMAPNFKLEDIKFESVGNAKWSKEVFNHYLDVHPDKRYGDLALRLTQNAAAPFEKAKTIVDYLSKNSIYTLSPKHEVKADEDPVAPYLFGDLRGYCVHFAHAIVYMLRTLGIPARIATGYLTDLSQSKDGHILLRMSDRHAWAEAYITGYGWIPFDPQPEQVESAADTNIDMNLLEELMGKLDPGEEILPKDTLENEENTELQDDLYIPTSGDLVFICLLIISALILIKLYLYYSWAFPSSVKTKAFRTLRAIRVKLSEVGFKRHPGETNHEFRMRLKEATKIDPLSVTDLINELKYSNKASTYSKNFSARSSFNNVGKFLARIPISKRFLGLINPFNMRA
ncbi:MAG: transglutaminase-like domain-containing protein, partial [bacterium]|nr:transglutaminase-like domain-containing protein [bacterium]